MDSSNTTRRAKTVFLGLAPFLRMSISGADLRPVAQEMLSLVDSNTDNASLLMNLSTVLLCIGQHDIGLEIQAEALRLQCVYHLTASQQPAKFRLLMVMTPGDLAANTPLDCLLENSDIELIYYYITPAELLMRSVPEHDALIVGINESDENLSLLNSLEQSLKHWPKPVINPPQYIHNTDRNTASVLLQDIPGLLIPPTSRVSRQTLLDIAAKKRSLCSQFEGTDFPILLRPLDSYGGHGLDKIDSAEDIQDYLSNTPDTTFFLSAFIDYSNRDGLFSKFRIAMIQGKPYACHMAISTDWMIHYLNAGMFEDAHKRELEADFMQHFDDFVETHKIALDTIYRRSKLDYFCIDCAQTTDGQLLIFEIDHVMVVHAMDPEDLFPYKQIYMQKVQHAFRDYLMRLTNAQTTDCPPE